MAVWAESVRTIGEETKSGKLWVTNPDSGNPGEIAFIEIRNRDGVSNTAYLTRKQTKAVITALQETIDKAEPETIIEPDCDYIIDRFDYTWHKHPNGKYNISEPGNSYYAATTEFRDLLNSAPLRPFRVTTKTVTTETELEIIEAN